MGMELTLIGETSYQTRAFVENIVRIMARKKMTRLELGVRPSYVTKVLSGRENLTVKTMEAMAGAVGYEVVFGLRRLPGRWQSSEDAEKEIRRVISNASKRRDVGCEQGE